MKTSIIIPARYASSRFPGKPLVQLQLPSGAQKSLIELSWQAARAVKGVEDVFIATDDRRIAEAVELFGAKVIMTSEQCANGTERCAEAVERAKLTSDLIVNLQGDAPLTPAWFVEKLIKAMQDDPTAEMATPVLRLDRLTHGHFLEDRRNGRVGGTTAVFDN
ncbi:MAG: cytidylyltransferase domain-containing protein, partial [Paracoccaceae bacterium]